MTTLSRPDLPAFSTSLLLPHPLELSHQNRATLLDLDQFDKVIFISKNAVAYGLPLLEQFWPQWPLSLDWLAVGSATAGALHKFGVSAQFPELASSEGLLALSILKKVAGQKILIVRGVGGRETLKNELIQRGALVEYLEVYKRQTQHYSVSDFPKGDDVVALLYFW